jgi:GTP cyclohydrolase I
MIKLHDIQSSKDSSGLEIDRVGIKNLNYPIHLIRKRRKGCKPEVIQCNASFNLSVNLSRNFKGTHMSRFVEEIEKHRENISLFNLHNIIQSVAKKLDANSVNIKISFLYFLDKKAPVSGMKSIMDYKCSFEASFDVKNGFDQMLIVEVPIITVCPCSKAISKHGAHNQRAVLTGKVRTDKRHLWIEDLVKILENSGSSQVYGLLKREDEKYITETSFDNSMFVEDVVRNASLKLLKLKNVKWFNVSVESHESIHNHDAFAEIEIDKRTKRKHENSHSTSI